MKKLTTYSLSPDDVLKAVLAYYRIDNSPYTEEPDMDWEGDNIEITLEESVPSPRKRSSK